MGKIDIFSPEELFFMEPETLIEVIRESFCIEMPPSVESVEDMEHAGRMLGECASNYSYLINMAMAAKIRKRRLKREGADKRETEDALSREEIFSTYAEIMKTAYNAISRMITVKQEINDELHFTDGR